MSQALDIDILWIIALTRSLKETYVFFKRQTENLQKGERTHGYGQQCGDAAEASGDRMVMGKNTIKRSLVH